MHEAIDKVYCKCWRWVEKGEKKYFFPQLLSFTDFLTYLDDLGIKIKSLQ